MSATKSGSHIYLPMALAEILFSQFPMWIPEISQFFNWRRIAKEQKWIIQLSSWWVSGFWIVTQPLVNWFSAQLNERRSYVDQMSHYWNVSNKCARQINHRLWLIYRYICCCCPHKHKSLTQCFVKPLNEFHQVNCISLISNLRKTQRFRHTICAKNKFMI